MIPAKLLSPTQGLQSPNQPPARIPINSQFAPILLKTFKYFVEEGSSLEGVIS